MAHNPLLGSRISLISKKNIRYEGTLYSINEADATVALQNVRAYGTEGRESESEAFLPPQDTVHQYLLFRGCDIKDLHVHESTSSQQQQEENGPPSDPAIVSAEHPKGGGGDNASSDAGADTDKNADADAGEEGAKGETAAAAPAESVTDVGDSKSEISPAKSEAKAGQGESSGPSSDDKKNSDQNDESGAGEGADNNNSNNNASSQKSNKSNRASNNTNNRRKKNNSNNNNPRQMVGSGASLLRRKVRGVVEGDNGPENPNKTNFDFQSNLAEFSKSNDDNEDEEDFNEEENVGAYDKNDFFDSISCDVSDRQNGIDNRLRGKAERSLNTETFGATSLGYGRRNNRRYRGRGNGGRGRGSGGRGGGRGGRPREGNNRWKEGNGHHQSKGGRGGNRRTYGDGGLSANNTRSGGQ
mmetsp:Transcript_22059/g.33017  ORF Transcript_22059/g.33017 Transcript_22059/m.33017 type:complete len:414 (+) Transcript_22059:187-1428(+)|eukprot:CAMPEP_0203647698 /NCGR_PEP_ID=MMETSP0088-20131115/16490_1 /ASSEMBLY_ACC=CAM_ASM_001087 /TAXON_ID=426623 /ORGANISM="Chaetoceros affinis, Strain CCMP159" /LENGTH=413 /DNA_ID=CAMNT_0050505445 /DNA_START=101 /DNA_END=1342 /DNA_ORIENTATION=+